MNETRSSLLPTPMVLPSGDHVMLMFSPKKINTFVVHNGDQILKLTKCDYFKHGCFQNSQIVNDLNKGISVDNKHSNFCRMAGSPHQL